MLTGTNFDGGHALALVQSDGDRSVMGIPGQIRLCLPSVIDLINPERRSMTWNCDDSSARHVTLRRFHIMRSLPQRSVVAVSWTNVSTVRPLSPRQHRPSWKVSKPLSACSGTWSRPAPRGWASMPPLAPLSKPSRPSWLGKERVSIALRSSGSLRWFLSASRE